MLPFNFPGTGECAAHVSSPRIVFQSHLRRRVTNAVATGCVKLDSQLLADYARDFGGMVEAAFADARRVKRHGYQTVGLGMWLGGLGQALA